MSRTRCPAFKFFHLEDLLSFRAGDSRELFFDLTADHVRDDLIHSHILKVSVCDILAIPHDRYTVNDGLSSPDDGKYRRFRIRPPLTDDDPEQLFDLLRCQG